MHVRPTTLYSALLCLLIGCGGENKDTDLSGAGDTDANDTDATDTDAADTDPADTDTEAGPTQNVLGRHDHTLTVDGLERETIVYVGRGAESIDSPVIFVHHGTTGDGQRFYDNSQWKELADVEGFIAVFPSSLTWCFKEDENRDGDYDDPGEARVTTKWTNGKLGEDDGYPLCTPEEIAAAPADQQALIDHPEIDDVNFVDAQIDLLKTQYRIDPKRIYVTGFSNGASFTARLVTERSTVFAAAAVASGKLAIDPVLAERPMSVIQWVGTEDPKLIPADVDLTVSATMLDDHPELMPGFLDPMMTVVGIGGSPSYSEREVGVYKIGSFNFRESTASATNHYTFAFIEGLAHVYPQGPALVAAEVSWNFFKDEALP